MSQPPLRSIGSKLAPLIPVFVFVTAIYLGWMLLFSPSEGISPEDTINGEGLRAPSRPKISPKIVEKQKPSPPASIPENVNKAQKPPASSQKEILESPAATNTSPEAYSSPSQNVEFEVVNGWAVAQGDILLGKVDDKEHEGKKFRHKPEKTRLWPSAQIPYAIDIGISNPNPIRQAIEKLNSSTSLEFYPFNGEEDAIVFTPSPDLCASYVGRIGGHQPIFVSPKCDSQAIIHELMHALGFIHEQARADRDRFIEIHWDNIQEEFFAQFALFPEELIHEYTGSVFDFDFQSVMLYHPFAFAKNPQNKTMSSKTSRQIAPVKRGLSSVDESRIFYLYGQ